MMLRKCINIMMECGLSHLPILHNFDDPPPPKKLYMFFDHVLIFMSRIQEWLKLKVHTMKTYLNGGLTKHKSDLIPNFPEQNIFESFFCLEMFFYIFDCVVTNSS